MCKIVKLIPKKKSKLNTKNTNPLTFGAFCRDCEKFNVNLLDENLTDFQFRKIVNEFFLKQIF
jgi:hypothetical protein